MARLEFTPDQIDERIMNDPEMRTLAENDPTEFEEEHARLYRAFGYNKHGQPLRAAQKAMGHVSRMTGIPESIVQGTAAAVIPTVTTIGGAVAGGMAGGVGMPAGAMAGAIAGELANYGLGITEDAPTPVDLGLSAGLSVAGPLASRAKVGIAKGIQRLPSAGLTTHPLAAETLERRIASMRIPKEDVDMLRGLLDNVKDFRIKLPMTQAALKSELDTVTRSLKPDDPYIRELNAFTKALANKPNVSFKELMSTEKDLIAAGSENTTGIWKKLSGVLINDMEAQLQNPNLSKATKAKVSEGLEAFKMYSVFNKRHHAGTTLDKIVERSVTHVDGGDDMVRFNKKQFLKEMKNNKTLHNVFEPTEIKAMEDAIENIGYLAAPPGGYKQQIGAHAGAAGLLGTAGYMAGGYTGMLIGGVGVTGLISLALSSETGRRVVRHMATTGKGRLDVLELNSMLGKALAGTMVGTKAGVQRAENIDPVPGINAFPNME